MFLRCLARGTKTLAVQYWKFSEMVARENGGNCKCTLHIDSTQDFGAQCCTFHLASYTLQGEDEEA